MFLEHFTGFPALPHSGSRAHVPDRPDDPLLDPLVLGVLTTALQDESADSYQQGFRDGLRAAALNPDTFDSAEAAATDDVDDAGEVGLGEGDWHR